MKTFHILSLQFLLIIGSSLIFTGCESNPEEPRKSAKEIMQQDTAQKKKLDNMFKRPDTTLKILENGEPNFITVQHVLISFKGIYRIEAQRSQEEAKKLAYEVLEKAKSGEDFSQLMKLTDDSGLGTYTMANHGERTFGSIKEVEMKIFARAKMAKSFGDIAFGLKVGEVGIADHHEENSPFGWHIIKRIK
jgi:hypothetical protein